ncbi:LysR family transcriptional regulator [Methylobacterium sp. A54F]
MGKPSLSDLTAFAAVAEHRSFARAAVALGLSRSALSHTVVALERRLGQRLLHRTTRSVAPTEAGASLLRRIRPVLADLDRALDGFGEDLGSLSGTLRINASETAARLLLQTAVPTFLARHPGMALDLVVDGRFVDIVEAGFDAGARFGEAVPQDMIAVPFGGPARFVAVAAPDYLRTHDAPRTPGELHRHRCIRHRMPGGRSYRWEFERHGQDWVVEVPGTLTLNNNGLMVEAAAAGLGIAYVPEQATRALLQAGRLAIVLDEWSPPVAGLCLYYAGHRHVPAGLRAFIDVLTGRPEAGQRSA